MHSTTGGGGGGSSGLDANYPPPLNIGRKPLREGRGSWEGEFWEGPFLGGGGGPRGSVGGGGGPGGAIWGAINSPCAEVHGNYMQSNVQLACQACFQQFKQNQNCELAADTKPNMVRKTSM